MSGHLPECWQDVEDMEDGACLMCAALRACEQRICPSEEACLAYAMDEGIPYGIYGGKTPNQRREIRRTAK